MLLKPNNSSNGELNDVCWPFKWHPSFERRFHWHWQLYNRHTHTCETTYFLLWHARIYLDADKQRQREKWRRDPFLEWRIPLGLLFGFCVTRIHTHKRTRACYTYMPRTNTLTHLTHSHSHTHTLIHIYTYTHPVHIPSSFCSSSSSPHLST